MQVEKFIRRNNEKNQIDYEPGSIQYINDVMSRYNSETYYEIIRKKDAGCSEDIDTELLRDFSTCIERYMDENAPGQSEFKHYIKMISTYLAFISKKPLHSPGMVMMDGDKIIEKQGKYYCPLKRYQIYDDSSLCIFCVCRDMYTEV